MIARRFIDSQGNLICYATPQQLSKVLERHGINVSERGIRPSGDAPIRINASITHKVRMELSLRSLYLYHTRRRVLSPDQVNELIDATAKAAEACRDQRVEVRNQRGDLLGFFESHSVPWATATNVEDNEMWLVAVVRTNPHASEDERAAGLHKQLHDQSILIEQRFVIFDELVRVSQEITANLSSFMATDDRKRHVMLGSYIRSAISELELGSPLRRPAAELLADLHGVRRTCELRDADGRPIGYLAEADAWAYWTIARVERNGLLLYLEESIPEEAHIDISSLDQTPPPSPPADWTHEESVPSPSEALSDSPGNERERSGETSPVEPLVAPVEQLPPSATETGPLPSETELLRRERERTLSEQLTGGGLSQSRILAVARELIGLRTNDLALPPLPAGVPANDVPFGACQCLIAGLLDEAESAALETLYRETCKHDLVEVIDADGNLVGYFDKADAWRRWPQNLPHVETTQVRLQASISCVSREDFLFEQLASPTLADHPNRQIAICNGLLQAWSDEPVKPLCLLEARFLSSREKQAIITSCLLQNRLDHQRRTVLTRLLKSIGGTTGLIEVRDRGWHLMDFLEIGEAWSRGDIDRVADGGAIVRVSQRLSDRERHNLLKRCLERTREQRRAESMARRRGGKTTQGTNAHQGLSSKQADTLENEVRRLDLLLKPATSKGAVRTNRIDRSSVLLQARVCMEDADTSKETQEEVLRSLQTLLRDWRPAFIARRIESVLTARGEETVVVNGRRRKPRSLVFLATDGDDDAMEQTVSLLCTYLTSPHDDPQTQTDGEAEVDRPWWEEDKSLVEQWVTRTKAMNPAGETGRVARNLVCKIEQGKACVLSFDEELYDEVAHASIEGNATPGIVEFPFPTSIIPLTGFSRIWALAVYELETRTSGGARYGQAFMLENGGVALREEPRAEAVAERLVAYLDCDNAYIETVYVDGGGSAKRTSPERTSWSRPKLPDSVVTGSDLPTGTRMVTIGDNGSRHSTSTRGAARRRAHFRRGYYRRCRIGNRDHWHYEMRWIRPTFVHASEGAKVTERRVRRIVL